MLLKINPCRHGVCAGFAVHHVHGEILAGMKWNAAISDYE